MTQPTLKLTIELVPATSWGDNVRSRVSRTQWDVLRKQVYANANYHCECCERPVRVLDCHEIWQYDELTRVQTLAGLQALCKACHQVKHIGRAAVMGHYVEACQWLQHVNKMDNETMNAYLVEVFSVYQRRSQMVWTVNIDWLNKADGDNK